MHRIFCQRGLWGIKIATNEPYLLEVLARRGVVIDAWSLALAHVEMAGNRAGLSDRIRAAVAPPENH
jgi:hypothetical protein